MVQPTPQNLAAFQAAASLRLEREQEDALPDREPAKAQEPPKDAKIMLVDQEELALELLQVFLEEVGYRHFVATTRAEEVIDLAFSERPDVVMLDPATGDASGFEILAQMRNDKVLQHIPVIVLTAATDAATKLKALKLGATDFLTKPVDSSELTLRLRNALAAKAYQDRLANCDQLTGLPNRDRFTDRLDWAIRLGRRHAVGGAVLQIGLDRFRQINEALGPAVGDWLLRAVAKRLESSLRDTDIVARIEYEDSQALLSRMGGDEFTILLPLLPESADAGKVAQRLLDVIARPFSIGGQELFITGCIGIAFFPNDGTARDTVLRAAAVALRHAKSENPKSYRYFSRELNARSADRLNLETELRRAIERSELELFYQPKVDLQSGRLVGAEALVRWRHPQRGMVNPGDFIPIAEETGLIVSLGLWVLNEACRQIARWQAAGRKTPRVSVNVSSHQFRAGNLAQQIQDALAEAGIAAHCLALEVTESVMMEQAQHSIRSLHELAAGGVALSIDDFGTGYSSLSYLKRLPIEEIKVDRSFVTGVERDKDSAAIVTAIIAMAHSLGLRVVAEGVETTPERDFLLHNGCDECQGYLYSRPLPASDFSALMGPGELPVLNAVEPVAG